MKRMMMAAACLLITVMIFAQTDTSSERVDTLTAGNFIIIKKKTGSQETENKYRDDMGSEYRSSMSYTRRYYSYHNFSEVPAVSKLVDNIVDVAMNISDYFSRSSLYSLSYLNHYNYKPRVYKTKKSKKQPTIIKINGDRYVLDKTDARDSD